MTPLQNQLASLRRRIRFVTLCRGLSIVCLTMAGGLLLAGLLDWRFSLPPVIRAMLLMLIGVATFLVGAYFLAPLWKKLDDLTLALKVENSYPILNDSLASTVQFLKETEDSGASSTIRREAMQRALRLAQGCDFTKVVDRRGFWPSIGGAASLIALGLVLCIGYGEIANAAMMRLFHPFGEHTWPKATRMEVDYPKRIATGQLFVIKGTVTRVIPETVDIEFDGLYSVAARQTHPIEVSEDGKTGTFTIKVPTMDQHTDFQFRLCANDAIWPLRAERWSKVEVGKPPVLVALDDLPTPQVILFYPDYTEKVSPEPLSPGTAHISAIDGTKAILRAATDRPITSAWIQYLPGFREQIYLQLAQAMVPMQIQPLNILTVHGGTELSMQRIPAMLDASGTQFNVEFVPWVSGNYLLHIEDEDGLAKDYEFGLEVQPDPAPFVNILEPNRNRSLLPNALLSLRVSAEDERFAVKSAYLQYRRKREDGRFLDSVPVRMPLYDGPEIQSAWGQTASAFSMLPITLPQIEKIRPKVVILEKRWSLAGLGQEGDIIVVQACADDFNDVMPHPRIGLSHELEIRIVSRSQFDGMLDREQNQLQQALLRLREWQDKAVKNVLEVEQQLKNAGEMSEKDLQLLREAEQLQKQIEARLGTTKKEGVRGKLEELQQTIRDNNIRSSSSKDRIDVLKKEIDRLAKEHVPQVTSKMTNTRQEVDSSKKSEKTAENTKANLAEAKKDQREIQKTLDELLDYMAQWADRQQIRDEARSILNEQQNIQNDTKQLNEPFRPEDPEWEAKLNRIAATQRELARKTQRLLDKMERVSQEKMLKDPEMSEMLDKAASIGRDDLLPAAMRDIADEQLPRKTINDTTAKQKPIIDTLEKMVEKLQENREEAVERLEKKQQDAQQELEKLAEKLEKLQKKTQEANRLQDPAAKKDALAKLAEEQRQLEAETRDKARELTRLRANDAAEQLRQAADKMAQAGQQLDAGLDAEEDQEQALEKLEQAQAEVEQAQEQTKSELARERLAKIADQITDLRDRQIATVVESERLHKGMLREGWQRDRVISLTQNGTIQENLGDETLRMAEQLKQAKVFALILNKAGENMKEAAKVIAERKDKIVQAGRIGIFPLDEKELKEENRSQEEILRLQNRAKRRLENLVAAIKAELDEPKALEKKEEKDKENQPEQKPKDGEQPKGGIQAQDGIPGVAQLKALRAEQVEVNNRTKDFAEQHPDPTRFTEAEINELQQIQADQEAVFALFREMLKAATTKENPNAGGENQ